MSSDPVDTRAGIKMVLDEEAIFTTKKDKREHSGTTEYLAQVEKELSDKTKLFTLDQIAAIRLYFPELSTHSTKRLLDAAGPEISVKSDKANDIIATKVYRRLPFNLPELNDSQLKWVTQLMVIHTKMIEANHCIKPRNPSMISENLLIYMGPTEDLMTL
jgi:hypothetical protein